MIFNIFNKKRKHPIGTVPYFPDYKDIFRRSKKI